jgi:cobalt/nickel transport system permease protein
VHIPDGYLSPQTCAVMYVAMVPFWAVAVKKLKYALSTKQVPLMVIGAAFSFIIMMFNVPTPAGTTAHAVGASLLAIILGPWATTICVSIALAIQALFFGDGGITTFGANSFNMAVVIPFVSYFLYALIAGKSEVSNARRWIGGLVGGYVGICAAALFAGIEFGIQPALFHTASGQALYAPYSLGLAISAMLFTHLTVAGPVEGIVTALVLRYLQARDSTLLAVPGAAPTLISGFSKWWYALIALIVLSPLGLLASGGAWGEWGASEIAKLNLAGVKYTPTGLARLNDVWHSRAILPDYGFKWFGDKTPFGQQAFGYIVAAVVGVAVIAVLTWLFARYVVAKQDTNPSKKDPKGK